MSLIAVVPVKSFALGKGRLSGALDSTARARLGKGLAEHVTSTISSAGLSPLVVTADPGVKAWATSSEIATAPDPGTGLNGAMETATAGVGALGDSWLVIHSDLPLLTPDEVSALAEPLAKGRPVIAASSDGGTSAVGWDRPVAFAFGVASFHRHLSLLDEPVVVARRGLLLDIDSPRDLLSAASTPEGRWLREFSNAIRDHSSGVGAGPAPGHNLY